MDVMSESEQEARSQGWVPKEEFKGDPDSWVDAEKFVERGEKIAAIATKKSKELESKLEKIEKEREEDRKIFAEFKNYTDEVRQRDRETVENWYKNELANIKAAKREAIKEGDNEKLADIEDYKDNLEDRYKEEKDKLNKKDEIKDTNKSDPDFDVWVKDNSWYQDDEIMLAYANHVGSKMYKEKFSSNMEFYKKVEEKVREKFPDKFSNPNREKSNTVEGAGGHKQSKGKTFDDLPPHAKAACNRFCKTIKGFTKEQYLRDVDWDAIMKEAENA